MSRSVRIDEDLYTRIEDIAKNNGISVKGYLNGLLEKAIKKEQQDAVVEKEIERALTLDHLRHSVADKTFEEYDFGKAVVEAHDGWEIFGTTYKKNVYYKLPSDPRDAPTHMRVFHIEFKDGLTEIASITESISAR